MLLEIVGLELVASFLIAFALLSLFLLTSHDRKIGDRQLLIIIITSVIFIWIGIKLFSFVQAKLVGRIGGLATLLCGAFLAMKYPTMKIQYYGPNRGLSHTGILIGLILIILGIYWTFF
ncbi:MAG: hypothetical protein DRP08_00190 [Candidatus Aenigmatarchaeota archaeon]|nr:MAG: hypothetical protein DRP08_00190 [Candidatus Aenigmarchaeota archaeon]